MLSRLQSYWDNPNGWLRHTISWIRRTDPTKTPLSLPELRALRFVLFIPDCVNEVKYDRVAEHRIHSIDWSASLKLKISFLNLVGLYGGRIVESKYSAIRGNANLTKHPRPQYLAKYDLYITQGKKIFDVVEARGWEIQDVVYDNHYAYPASEKEQCVDKDICAFVERHARDHEHQDWVQDISRGCEKWGFEKPQSAEKQEKFDW